VTANTGCATCLGIRIDVVGEPQLERHRETQNGLKREIVGCASKGRAANEQLKYDAAERPQVRRGTGGLLHTS
jgi:hypothetical protein